MFRQVKLAIQAAVAMAAHVMDGSVTHTMAKGGGRNSGAASHRGGHKVAAQKRAAKALRHMRARGQKGDGAARFARRQEQKRLRLIAACRRSEQGTPRPRDEELLTSYGIPPGAYRGMDVRTDRELAEAA